MTIYLYPVHVTSNKCWKCLNKLWFLRCHSQSNWYQYLSKIMRMMHKSFKYMHAFGPSVVISLQLVLPTIETTNFIWFTVEFVSTYQLHTELTMAHFSQKKWWVWYQSYYCIKQLIWYKKTLNRLSMFRPSYGARSFSIKAQNIKSEWCHS